MAALRPDGSVVFLGNCAYRGATRPLEAYVRDRGRSGADVFLAVVREPAGVEAKAFAAFVNGVHPTWRQLPPSQRAIGPGADPQPPAEVVRELTEVGLLFRLPAAWRTMPGAFCARLSIAWVAECTRLGVNRQRVVTSYLRPGEPLEIWLMNSSTDLRTGVGVVGRVPYRAVRPGTVITIVGDPEVRTYEQLRRVAVTTHDALRAA